MAKTEIDQLRKEVAEIRKRQRELAAEKAPKPARRMITAVRPAASGAAEDRVPAPPARARVRKEGRRTTGKAAPVREEEEPKELFASAYPWFDRFGRQTPWWQPDWIPQLTGSPPMRNVDIFNYFMRTPRALQRQLWERLQGL